MFIILQTETGYMDGCYGSVKGAKRALESWETRYPESEFEIQATDVIPPAIRDDNKFLPRVYYKAQSSA